MKISLLFPIAQDEKNYYEIAINMEHPVFGTGRATPLGQYHPSRATEAARYVRQGIAHLIPIDVINSEIFDGNARIIPTRWLPNWEFFDETLQPYNYSIGMAKEMIYKAGFSPPCGDPAPYSPEPNESNPTRVGLIVLGGIALYIGLVIWLNYSQIRKERKY